ncbi:MAG: nitroreductase family protein [Acidobacteriota bacterium]
MDFFDVIRIRRSVRAFESKAIEPEKWKAILDAVNIAPSAGNLQAYEVFEVRQRTHRLALARAALEQYFISEAPAALVFCAHPARSAGRYGRRGMNLYCVQDATIACAYAQLAATALGLASVWVGAFDDNAVRRAIGIGADLVPVAILPIGYPAETPLKTPRRSLSDLVHSVE